MRWYFPFVLLVIISCKANPGMEKYPPRKPTNQSKYAYTDDCFSQAGQLIIKKVYQRKNLYFTNPKLYCTDSTTRFATMNITINDTIFIPYDSLESEAFEIPLYLYNFKAGDSLRIVIKHYAGGKPKLLNPEVY